MRTIKFRVWDEENEEMVYEAGITPEGIPYTIPSVSESFDQFDYYPHCHKMQYTGLKDKNGTEIYEGDILQGNHYPIGKEDGYVLVVEYEYDRFWGVRTKKADSDVRGISDGIADGLYEFEDSELEVIGNIYENPDLLKQ